MSDITAPQEQASWPQQHDSRTLYRPVSESVPQDRIPDDNGLGAFRIGDQVWLNVNGCIHKIDVKIDDDEEEGSDVNLDAWKALPLPKVRVWPWLMTQPHLHERSNSVVLTFERKKVDIC